MAQILCSTGAIIGRPNGRNYYLLTDILPKLNCDGIEFMMYSTWYDDTHNLIPFLQSLNLNIPVVHCQKTIGELITQGGNANLAESFSLFEINCRLAQSIGASKLVFHLWNGKISDSCIENNLKAYKKLAQISNAYGIQLLIENVVCNCADPLTHWLELIKLYPNVRFVFDTKMAAFHNQLNLLYQPEYAFLHQNHIAHYPTNDYAGGYMDWANLKTLPIGKGNIDFRRFFGFIKETGYNETFTVESTAFNTNGEVNVEMLNTQFDYIRSMLK